MNSYLLKNATLATLTPTRLEHGDLRIADGRITAKGDDLPALPEEAVRDCAGKLILPGLVCAHTHLYSALARGMPGPRQLPANFPQILEYVWWRLDRALDAEAIYYSAAVGVLDAIASGTTTIIDHHASPSAIPGSLRIMQEVFESFGMRGVLCYEVTDRGGQRERDQGLMENRWLLEHPTALVKGLVGAHAAFTLNDDALRLCAELVQTFQSGVHIHVAEDRCDVAAAQLTFGQGVLERLAGAGLINARSLLAHGVHLTPAELRQLDELGGWLVHNPRSNMNNGVGYAPVAQFGRRVALGTDGITANMFEELKFMYFKAQDAHAGLSAADCLRFLSGGQQFASELYGLPLGTLAVGAAADLLVLDYPSPTPLHEGNLAWHLIFGLTQAHLESVMIAGRFVLENRQFTHPDARAVYQRAQGVAAKLWQRMQ